MKLSRDWLSDFVDLSDLSDDVLAERFTQIGHAVESMETSPDDTVFDLEITTNRVDAMSHFGMARELGAAFGRELRRLPEAAKATASSRPADVSVRIDAPDMCSRYAAAVVRGLRVGPSPERVRRRLVAVGLRPINNVVDATNYAMLALGHPLHAFDLDLLTAKTIVARAGLPGETIRGLDDEVRKIDPQTVVIADGRRAVALGGIIGGAETEISVRTTNVLLECAWFQPAFIRRTAKRLSLKTDASYRFERGVDANGTLQAIEFASDLIIELAGGSRDPIIDVVAGEVKPKAILLRSSKLREASSAVVGDGYALELFRRLEFDTRVVPDGLQVAVPTFRGDLREEADLVEEVLRFFGLNNIPASLPRLTTGDVRYDRIYDAVESVRRLFVESGLSEAITYSFIRADRNALFSDEEPVAVTNSLTENIAAMRLSLLPGLLEAVAFNRSYGSRDGAIFEVGRTYHRAADGTRERHQAAFVLFGGAAAHWGDPKRPFEFFDAKGIVEQIAKKFHIALEFAACDRQWLKKGRRALARHQDRTVATVGMLSPEVLQQFDIKGEILAAEIDIEPLVESEEGWKMAPVSRFPGVPMILAVTHGGDLDYQRIVDAIRSFEVPLLHEVGLRDRFVPEGEGSVVKTTLGMWYQAFDRSLTQDEVSGVHRSLATRLVSALPVKLL